jgi:hypothetical protein
MRVILCLLVLFTSLSAQADIVHLRDGSRYYAAALRDTKNDVAFRIVPAGQSSAGRRRLAAGRARTCCAHAGV